MGYMNIKSIFAAFAVCLLFATSALAGSLTMNQQLNGGQSISSSNDAYMLTMQTDGNLVLYKKSPFTALWSSGTQGHPGARAIMQSDGNLVVYSPSR